MNDRLRIGIAEAIGTMILVVGGPGPPSSPPATSPAS